MGDLVTPVELPVYLPDSVRGRITEEALNSHKPIVDYKGLYFEAGVLDTRVPISYAIYRARDKAGVFYYYTANTLLERDKEHYAQFSRILDFYSNRCIDFMDYCEMCLAEKRVGIDGFLKYNPKDKYDENLSEGLNCLERKVVGTAGATGGTYLTVGSAAYLMGLVEPFTCITTIAAAVSSLFASAGLSYKREMELRGKMLMTEPMQILQIYNLLFDLESKAFHDKEDDAYCKDLIYSCRVFRKILPKCDVILENRRGLVISGKDSELDRLHNHLSELEQKLEDLKPNF
ncbi:hypothetical protein KY330_03915 [Candidatus Woesearchaeota archaeon]|nr:hypothetical protein [Candidatus Woesearchaeota archaeon]